MYEICSFTFHQKIQIKISSQFKTSILFENVKIILVKCHFPDFQGDFYGLLLSLLTRILVQIPKGLTELLRFLKRHGPQSWKQHQFFFFLQTFNSKSEFKLLTSCVWRWNSWFWPAGWASKAGQHYFAGFASFPAKLTWPRQMQKEWQFFYWLINLQLSIP